MNLESFLQKIFGYRLLEEVESAINGRIRVIEDIDGRRVVAGGPTQSGGYMRKIWQEGLKEVRKRKIRVKNCLILGLGAGTAAALVAKDWPEAKIVGVELDPIMVDLGKKYFDLSEISNLEVVIADAAEWVKKAGSQFDLILVDVYKGGRIPVEVRSEAYFNKLKRLKSKNGLLVFDLLVSQRGEQAESFLQELKEVFPEYSRQKVATNLLCFAT